VASATPYELTQRVSGAHRARISSCSRTYHASEPAISSRMKSSRSPVSRRCWNSERSTAGTNSAVSTACRRIRAYSAGGSSSVSMGTGTSLPPEHSARTRSPPNTSNEKLAICRCEVGPGRSAYASSQAR
jgi:hypothetical protein